MIIKEVIKRAKSLSKNSEDENALFWLLLEYLEYDQTELYLNFEKELTNEKTEKYFDLANKYLNENVPVQYLIGHSYFYGRKFYVNENTLIPRPETEELVQRVINYSNQFFVGRSDLNILDLATGSGCIGITLKKEKPQYQITASDVNKEALMQAQKNAKMNQCEITFIESDWLNNINQKFDIIVSNPPYIPNDYQLEEKVLKEPFNALYSGKEGIDSYQEILLNINKNINKKAMIAFEHGYDQKKLIANLVQKHLKNVKIIQEKDLSDKDRYTFIFIE